ncbi:MAG: DUF4880 domain-containing protein [Alteromonadales bacterium]|nr:DUF4880 domain-containing protein [Alteromonadales bacterium]
MTTDSDIDQAIEWLVTMRSGDVSPQEMADFSRWHQQNSRHVAAWEMVNKSVNSPFIGINDSYEKKQVERIIMRPQTRRQFINSILSFTGLGASVLLISNSEQAITRYFADYQTATAERKSIYLADANVVELNALSAIDISVSTMLTEISLRQGELLFDGKQSNKQKTIISSTYGQVISTGGRCNIKLTDGGCYVLSLDKEIKVLAKNHMAMNLVSNKRFITLQAGQAITLSAQGTGPIVSDQAHKAQWTKGMYIANDDSLAELMTAFESYYTGYIKISQAAQKIRVYGQFPLDDITATLAALRHSLPVKIRQLSGLFILIEKN